MTPKISMEILIWDFMRMNDKYVLTEYELSADLPCPVTFALAADMHEREPDSVLKLLKESQPDVIFIAGDTFERMDEGQEQWMTLNSDRMEYESVRQRLFYTTAIKLNNISRRFGGKRAEAKDEYAYRFLREAGRVRSAQDQTAPVFLSIGNHERYLSREDNEVITNAGVTLLHNRDVTVTVRGMKLRIGGLSTKADEGWLESFCRKDGYKILMCHHPEYYEKYLKEKNINLILSGHAHGGQWRICGHGVFAPGQGLFPGFCHGVYDGRLVVSAGCSNTTSIPRFGNPCEVVVIRLNPGKQ